MGIKKGVLSIKAAINLYQALVVSGLEFSAEVWGFDKWEEGEQIQLNAARYILRCSSSTSKPALIGELGLMSLYGRRNYKTLVYWMKIISLPNSRLIKHVYLYSKSQCHKKANWCANTKGIFIKYGLQEFWDDNKKVYNLDGNNNNNAPDIRHHINHWKNYVKKKILAFEENQWLVLIKNPEKYSKLRTYCLFKTKLKLEKYLYSSNSYGKQLHTSIRTGTNKLEIETGRWNNVEVTQRICKNCDQKVIEDEVHFVVQCPRYTQFRMELFEKICNISNSKWDLNRNSIQDRFILLVNGTQDEWELKIFELFHIYLVKCFKARVEVNC